MRDLEELGQYLSAFQEMMAEMESDRADLILPPPEREKLSLSVLISWFSLNAMAWGIRRGKAEDDTNMMDLFHKLSPEDRRKAAELGISVLQVKQEGEDGQTY